MVTIMPEPQNDTGAEKSADKGRETQRAAAGRGGEAIQAEPRTFDGNGPQEAARTGLGVAREMARQGAEATRQIAESGRQTTSEIADLWRDAFNPLLRSQLEMSRWFDQAWRQMTGLDAFTGLHAARPFAALGPASLFGLPPADLRETETAYELSVELPGMNREEIDLKIRGDAVILRGAKTERHDASTSGYRVSERRFGRFERSFPIPADARRDGATAQYADGLLTVTLPKSTEGEASGERIIVR
jgi:HSP20 family protein